HAPPRAPTSHTHTLFPYLQRLLLKRSLLLRHPALCQTGNHYPVFRRSALLHHSAFLHCSAFRPAALPRRLLPARRLQAKGKAEPPAQYSLFFSCILLFIGCLPAAALMRTLLLQIQVQLFQPAFYLTSAADAVFPVHGQPLAGLQESRHGLADVASSAGTEG